jgi:hypothetical protein
MAAHLHFAKHALSLHFLLQHSEGLIDIVVTDEDLHAAFLLGRAVGWTDRQAARANDARLQPDLFPVSAQREPKVDRSPISRDRWAIRRPSNETAVLARRQRVVFAATSLLAYRD